MKNNLEICKKLRWCSRSAKGFYFKEGIFLLFFLTEKI